MADFVFTSKGGGNTNNNLFYQTNTKEWNSFKIAAFKFICDFKGITISTHELPYADIPTGIPSVMREFYSQFAPVSIYIEPLRIEFMPYTMAFDWITKNETSSLLPIGRYNGCQPIYMDKYPDGTWDKRIQLYIGNGKVHILGEDIFDFIAQLALRLSE